MNVLCHGSLTLPVDVATHATLAYGELLGLVGEISFWRWGRKVAVETLGMEWEVGEGEGGRIDGTLVKTPRVGGGGSRVSCV